MLFSDLIDYLKNEKNFNIKLLVNLDYLFRSSYMSV